MRRKPASEYWAEIEADSKRIERSLDMEDVENESEFWDWFNKTMQGNKRGKVTKRQKETLGRKIVQRRFGKDDEDWYKNKTKWGWRDVRTGHWTKAPQSHQAG